MSPQIAPYGSWESPITAAMLTETGVRLMEIRVDGEAVYWLEGRPLEGGRYALVIHSGGETRDLLPPPWNARTLVHEYGGGSYTVRDGTVFFANYDDQRVYRLEPGGEPVAVTPEPPADRAWRYADLTLTPDGATIVCVRERHDTGGEPSNKLVAFPADGSRQPEVLAFGRDFYSSPRFSPDGTGLAWVEWDHPNMPWDGTELRVGAYADGAVRDVRRVAGDTAESVFQPGWDAAGTLHFVSDRTGWWNLYRWDGEEAVALAPRSAEFGVPAWLFGFSRYAFLDDGRLVAAYREGGRDHLTVVPGGDVGPVAGVPGELGQWLVAGLGTTVWAVGGDADLADSVVAIDVDAGGYQVVRRGSTLELPADLISAAEPIEFPTEGGLTAHAYFYPPRNPDFAAPEGELPPLVVMSHGGPTSATGGELSPAIQFWTSRGVAVVDVDYGGSTGYGREYRERLKGTWGIVDVADCINAARHLAGAGRVDGKRMAIRGGSAGGFTTLNALAFHDVFGAGASYYGVADLAGLAAHTHKFESRYLDGLVGPWPEAKETYQERSAVFHADGISCPVILLQGLEDAVVPPAQAEAMVAALDANGVPHAYLAFPGEQHGFRKAENQVRALEAELWFYGRVFGFAPADEIEPVEIAHLD